ncbi:hypothetical protein ACM14_02430 [Delftia sp. JD2]|nr:hypothetical protein ACM14_02430 [Delftia sp. JD2]
MLPVIMAALAAVVAIVHYGIQAFALPTWALACGAAASILAVLLTLLLREGPRERLMKIFFVAAKIVGLLLLTAGAMAIAITSLPALPDQGPSRLAEMDANLTTTAFGLIEAFAWIAVVALPMVLCIITLYRLRCELQSK